MGLKEPGIVAGMAMIMALPLLLIVPIIPGLAGIGTGLAVGLGFRMAQVYRIVMTFGRPEQGPERSPP